jgi:hypothetical protein
VKSPKGFRDSPRVKAPVGFRELPRVKAHVGFRDLPRVTSRTERIRPFEGNVVQLRGYAHLRVICYFWADLDRLE